MPTFTIDLCPSHAQRLRVIAKRNKVAPEEALLAHVKEWLESEVPVVPEPGVTPAPPGMFTDYECEFSFFDPAQADPSRAEDYLTPEQRLDAIAETCANSDSRAERSQTGSGTVVRPIQRDYATLELKQPTARTLASKPVENSTSKWQ